MPYSDLDKQREYQRNWARSHRTNKYRDVNRRRIRRWVRDLKEKTPCKDCCGYFSFVCMQFDHVRGKKIRNVGEMVSRNAAFTSVKKEINKCDLVCANCHAIRTNIRNGVLEK